MLDRLTEKLLQHALLHLWSIHQREEALKSRQAALGMTTPPMAGASKIKADTA